MLTLFIGQKCLACHQEEQYLYSLGVEFATQDIGINGAAKNFVQNRNGGQVTVPFLWDGTNGRGLTGFLESKVDGFLKGLE